MLKNPRSADLYCCGVTYDKILTDYCGRNLQLEKATLSFHAQLWFCSDILVLEYGTICSCRVLIFVVTPLFFFFFYMQFKAFKILVVTASETVKKSA